MGMDSLPLERGALLYEATGPTLDTDIQGAGEGRADAGEDAEPTIEERRRVKQEAVVNLLDSAQKLLFIGLGMFAFPLAIIYFTGVLELWPMFVLVLLMFGVVYGLLVMIRHAYKFPIRERIYENGFTVKDGFGREIFVPWGRAKAYKEYDVEVDKEVPDEVAYNAMHWDAHEKGVMLYGNGYVQKLISGDVDNYDRIIYLVRTRVGYDEDESYEWDASMRSTFVRAMGGCLALALFAGFIFAVFPSLFSRTILGEGAQGYIITSLLISIVCLGLFMVYITYYLWGVPKGVYPYIVVLAMTGILVLSSIGVASSSEMEAFGVPPYIRPTPSPGQSVVTMGVHENESLFLYGPITVGPHEVLTLRDCYYVFELEWGDEYGIWVHSQGRLEMYNTHLSTAGSEWMYELEIHGEAWIENCTFESMDGHYDPGGVHGEVWLNGGIDIKSSSVTIIGSTFNYAEEYAILIDRCMPTIRDCHFFKSGRGGLFCYGGDPWIVGCTFEKGPTGVVYNPVIISLTHRTPPVPGPSSCRSSPL